MSATAWTFTATGLALGLIGIGVLFAAWWSEANRNDRTEAAIAAICVHLGIEIVHDDAPDPDTDEIPVQPGIPTEPMPVAAATPAVQARRDTAWDADAAQLRPVPHPRTTSTGGRHRK